MNLIKVKTIASSQRCEVCHQTDQFDQQLNYCIRCSDITANINDQFADKSEIKQSDQDKIEVFTEVIFWFVSMIVLSLAIFLIYLIYICRDFD